MDSRLEAYTYHTPQGGALGILPRVSNGIIHRDRMVVVIVMESSRPVSHASPELHLRSERCPEVGKLGREVMVPRCTHPQNNSEIH